MSTSGKVRDPAQGRSKQGKRQHEPPYILEADGDRLPVATANAGFTIVFPKFPNDVNYRSMEYIYDDGIDDNGVQHGIYTERIDIVAGSDTVYRVGQQIIFQPFETGDILILKPRLLGHDNDWDSGAISVPYKLV